MILSIERVLGRELDKVQQVYEIIKESGRYMYEEHMLTHWKNPYPIDSIKKDCEVCEVYLVWDNESETYVNTFQLEFLKDKQNEKKSIVMVKKFATLPNHEGKGIGKFSIKFIESYCKNKGVSRILLDVYEKSNHAINFYEKRGFNIIGSEQTRNFKVFIMQMNLYTEKNEI